MLASWHLSLNDWTHHHITTSPPPHTTITTTTTHNNNNNNNDDNNDNNHRYNHHHALNKPQVCFFCFLKKYSTNVFLGIDYAYSHHQHLNASNDDHHDHFEPPQPRVPTCYDFEQCI
jgi:hypothetical protein